MAEREDRRYARFLIEMLIRLSAPFQATPSGVSRDNHRAQHVGGKPWSKRNLPRTSAEWRRLRKMSVRKRRRLYADSA